jgi:hypothetical protein
MRLSAHLLQRWEITIFFFEKILSISSSYYTVIQLTYLFIKFLGGNSLIKLLASKSIVEYGIGRRKACGIEGFGSTAKGDPCLPRACSGGQTAFES